MDLRSLIKTHRDPEAQQKKLNVLFAAAEVAPFSSVGNAGDVAASLPVGLGALGHSVSVVTPLYAGIDPEKLVLSRRLKPLIVPTAKAKKSIEVTVWERRVAPGVTIFFLDAPDVFGSDADIQKGDSLAKNAERLSFFSRAVVEFAANNSMPVDVIHCNDWQTALVSVFRDEVGKSVSGATVLTVHDAADQGVFAAKTFDSLGLPKKKYLTKSELLHGKDLNFLKAGIVHADCVTTVSEGYRDELLAKKTGFGLDAELKKKEFVGITNGANYRSWSPQLDNALPVQYDTETLNGKRRNKAAIQFEFGLAVRPTMPLLGYIGELTKEKGLDLLVASLRTLLKEKKIEFQAMVVGDGDQKYVTALKKLAKDYKDSFVFVQDGTEAVARKALAASDLIALPSLYEPCGLLQLHAMRYGTVPVVHAVGGFADTVIDVDSSDDGTGFVFEKYDTKSLTAALERGLALYHRHREWRPLMVRAMEREFSWARSAEAYQELYLSLRAAA